MRYLKYIFLCMMMVIGGLNMMAQSDRNLIRSGNRLFREQNYAKAEVEYRKAISKNPNNAQAVYNLGNALMAQQKDSAAIEQFTKAGKMETSPVRRAKSYHNIGTICQKTRLYSEAIGAYQEALRDNPNDNETRYNLALCKRLLKNQPQQNKQNKNNKDKNKDNKKDENKDKNKNKNKNKDKDKDKQNQQKQPKEQMSKDNAEQLLNAAMQEEKATQQRLKKAMQQPKNRRLQKNW